MCFILIFKATHLVVQHEVPPSSKDYYECSIFRNFGLHELMRQSRNATLEPMLKHILCLKHSKIRLNI